MNHLAKKSTFITFFVVDIWERVHDFANLLHKTIASKILIKESLLVSRDKPDYV